MPESDIRVLTAEVGMLKLSVSNIRDDFKSGQEKMLATMHELAVNVNKIAENDIKRDERDKHEDERRHSYDKRISRLEADSLKFNLYVAADEPIRSYRKVFITGLITALAASISVLILK